MVKPVYVFSGFLDSGKTSAIKETLYDGQFNQGEKTLIIAFEMGDVEYDDKFKKYTNTDVVYLDYLNELTFDKMQELDDKYQPERVFIELNGMDDDNELYNQGFIKNWDLAQTLTTVDASTFNLYLSNLKKFTFNHIVNAEVCIFNRADNENKRFLRNNIKAINQRCTVIFEDSNGNITNKIDDDLFDTSKEIIVEDIDYGLWCMDALENPLKYEDCKISLNLKYASAMPNYDNITIMGRKAMVCCADDIQDIAITCVNLRPEEIDHNKYYRLNGTIKCLDDEEGYKTCVLFVEEYEESAPPLEEMVYFN